MNADSYAGQKSAISSVRKNKKGKEDNGGETLFGLVLALTTMYGLGSLIAFLATWAAR